MTIADGMTGTVAAASNGLTIGGSGSLVLAGANAETGIVSVGSGTITVGSNTAFGAVADQVNDYGSAIQANAGTSAAVSPAAGGLVEAASPSTIVTVTVANTFTIGETVVIAGATPAGLNGTFIILTATAAPFSPTPDPTTGLGTSTVGGTAVVQNFSITNPIALDSGAGAVTSSPPPNQRLAAMGIISGTGNLTVNMANAATTLALRYR